MSIASAQHLQFPDGFLWGTATSAYRAEGGNKNNQWYEFERPGETVRDGCGNVGPAHQVLV